MAFCGQCGLQLPPGKTACPRCGTPTEPEFDLIVEDPHENDPTIAALSSYGPDYQPPVEASASPQQKLVLRPEGNGHNFSNQAVSDPTSRIGRPGQPDYPGYPAYEQRASVTPANPYVNASYPTHSPQSDMVYQSAAGQYGTMATQAPAHKRKGHTVALLLILLGLLVILSALTLFVLKQQGLLGGNPTPTPSQQAQAVISQYYDDINRQDYHSAYNLWAVNSQYLAGPYDQFVRGYAHTRHDNITFDNVTPLANGTVKVAITIHASEENTPGALTQHIYQGYYIVGQRDGTWKILNGKFRQVS